MANEEHLKILKQGVEAWNKWREDNPEIVPDLSYTDLQREVFEYADFTGVDFSSTNLEKVSLRQADLSKAILRAVELFDAILIGAKLIDADLRQASMLAVNLLAANLNGANLEEADLSGAVFRDTKVVGTNFHRVRMGDTTFGNIDLTEAKGLEFINHWGSSSIGIDTLYKSSGKIPEEFLRGCGVPDDFITFIPSHFGIQQAIQFYSCFISYSTKDEEFARRLYSRMREEKLRVWFAPEDMKGGQKLHEQIEQAIQLHDRLLIILSEESMASEWVKREIRRARRTEIEQKRRKLFPIRLVDYKTIENWKGFDSDGGEDLAFELGKYYIPDFSNWKDHDSFGKGFERLLRDLRAEEERQAEKRDRK